MTSVLSICPEVIDRRLTEGHAVCSSFNSRGTLLSVGCLDGRIMIWDFVVMGMMRVLMAHVRPITSLCWSRNSRKLLSSSVDWNVLVWDVESGQVERKFCFDSPVLSADFHSLGHCALVSSFMEPVHILNIEKGDRIQVPIIPKEIPNFDPTIGVPLSDLQSNKCVTNLISASFNLTCDRIVTGNGNGILAVFEFETLKLVHVSKIPGGGPIKAIRFSPRGNYFLLNSDKTMKLYRSDTYQYIRDFKDPIYHFHWRSGNFSNDEEFVIAGSAEKPLHNIYVWNIEGILEKTLEGPPEGVMDLKWHPKRPVIASSSAMGAVYIWTVQQTENWSAFAPDFQELEENQIYIEKEDEFDLVDEKESLSSKKGKDEVEYESLEEDDEDGENPDDELWFLPPTIPKISLT